MNQLKKILVQFRDLYLNMTAAQRLSILLFGAGVLLFLGTVIRLGVSGKRDQILYSGVDYGQGSMITEKLTSLGIKNDFHDGIITIGSGENRDAAMMALAKENILPDVMPMSFQKLVEDSNFSLTKDERSRNYYLALQSELGRMIGNMDRITSAEVLITMEEESPLLKRHVVRQAAVQVQVRGNQSLSQEEVKGIVYLVSHGVKALSTADVVITDGKGRPYHLEDGLNPDDKLALKRKMEDDYRTKIINALSFIPLVNATLDVDLDLKEQRREKKDYASQDLNNSGSSVLTNTHQEKENSKSKEGSQGIVGAGTNTQAEIKNGDGSTEMETGKSLKKENFDNSVIQDYITYDGLSYQLKGVSVSISKARYNINFVPDADRSQSNNQYEEYDWIKDPEVGEEKLKRMVANAVGLTNNPALIEILQTPMVLNRAPVGPSMLEKIKAQTPWPLVLMILVSIVGLMMVLGMIRRAQPDEEILEMPVYDEEEKETSLTPLVEPQVDPRVRQIEKRVKEIIDENPAKAAALIRNWLSKD